jgi:hypothetical protein
MKEPNKMTDPIEIWKSQPINQQYLASIELHRKARNFQDDTRRKLAISLSGPIVAGGFYAFLTKSFPGLNQSFLLAAPIWSLIGAYFLHRGMWTNETPADTGLSTGLAFCRRELTRQHQLDNRLQLWMHGPILLTVATFVFALTTTPDGIFPKGLPFLVLFATWVVAYAVSRYKQRQAFRRELDELKKIEDHARLESLKPLS